MIKNVESLIKELSACVDNSLRQKKYRNNINPLAGMCYVICEAIYYLTKKQVIPHRINHENISHWYLKSDYNIIDPTVSQFKRKPNYKNGKRAAFLTKYPSKRCLILIKRWQNKGD
jgi:hypothetical protein